MRGGCKGNSAKRYCSVASAGNEWGSSRRSPGSPPRGHNPPVTQDTLRNGMDKRQSDEMTPSGISPRVRGKRPRDPDGNNGVSLARGDVPGLEDIISPSTIGSLQGLQQQNQFRISPAMEKATTMEAPKAARIEQTHKYPTRYSKNVTTNFTDSSGSRKRYTAATHLASEIKSDNIFTIMVIEEIAESIDALIDNNVK